MRHFFKDKTLTREQELRDLFREEQPEKPSFGTIPHLKLKATNKCQYSTYSIPRDVPLEVFSVDQMGTAVVRAPDGVTWPLKRDEYEIDWDATKASVDAKRKLEERKEKEE